MAWLWPPAPGTVSCGSGTKTNLRPAVLNHLPGNFHPATPPKISQHICWAGPEGCTLCQLNSSLLHPQSSSVLPACEKDSFYLFKVIFLFLSPSYTRQTKITTLQ